MPADDLHVNIWDAAREGDLTALTVLLAATPEIVHQQASDGCTPLHYAALGEPEEAVEQLLISGSDPNARSFAGHTPLHYAAFAGRPDSFRRLLAAGSDVHAVDDSLATMLHAAASGGEPEIVEILLAEGFTADTANLYGELPVHRAAQRNHTATVHRLLRLGSDANPVDRYDMTLLHKAAIGGAVDVIGWLLEQGLDPAAGNLVGDTAMHSAASLGRLTVVQFLLDRGFSPSERNYDQATPLHHAATAGHTAIVDLLLEQGVDAGSTDRQGRTPLHLAALRGHTDVVKSLLEASQCGIPDIRGHLPADLAAFYGRNESWEALADVRDPTPSAVNPDTVRALVRQSVGNREMMAWYLGHSGWAVRTQKHLFVLDYAPGEPERADASLVNGRIDPSEWGDVNVFVIATHHHGDHFDRRILGWDHACLRRVYGWNAPGDLPGFRFIEQEVKTIGDVVMASIPATDAGSAFLIEVDGVSFYYAGDHAAACDPVEDEFSEGVVWLADQFAPIQAAFLPVFGCGLPSPDTLRAGNAFTIEELAPEAVFPMHIGWTSYFYRRFGDWIREFGIDVGVGIADQPGDRFRIRNGTIEQVWI